MLIPRRPEKPPKALKRPKKLRKDPKGPEKTQKDPRRPIKTRKDAFIYTEKTRDLNSSLLTWGDS